MKFDFVIGGYLGESSYVRLNRKILHCASSPLALDPRPEFSVHIDISNNAHFEVAIDYLSRRNWRKEYRNEYILDGTFWHLTFIHDAVRIKSSGSNAYPAGFFKFLRLLNAVTLPEFKVW